jgi:hypothetical protein
MTSNGITITPSHSNSAEKALWGWVGGVGGGGGFVLGVVLGDLVDVDAWGNVPYVSKIDMLDFSTVY